MPYRYFGRTNQDFGRPLWEIVLNLKQFGTGRLVTRSAFTKECPDLPSFYKIVSVHPHILEYPDIFKGNIFVEEVFQGRKRRSVIDIGPESDKADFQLVPKKKEGEIYRQLEQFVSNPKNHEPTIRPTTAPLPPVWKLFIARDQNISPEDVPEIPLQYEDVDPELHKPTRPANPGEEPDLRVGPGHYTPLHKDFYKHVIWNRDAAREKYCSGPPADPDFVYADNVLPPLELEIQKSKTAAV